MKNKFKKKTKYKVLCDIFTPNGMVEEGTILTGAQWEDVLVYEVGNSFNQMFEVVKE